MNSIHSLATFSAIPLFVFVLLQLGCSSYSKNQCQEMDWYVEGKKAALDGYIPKQGKTLFIDKCREEKGVAMDTVEFDRGFASGLTKLCTPEGREKLEERGLKYQGTCEMHEDNLNLKKSRTIELEAEVSRLKAEIESLKSRECPAEPEPVD